MDGGPGGGGLKTMLRAKLKANLRAKLIAEGKIDPENS